MIVLGKKVLFSLRAKEKDLWFPLTLPGQFYSILTGQFILLAYLVGKNIFEANHVNFFNMN